MSNFFTDVIQRDPRYRSVDPVRDLELLEPTFRNKVDGVVASAMTSGIELVPVETFRSTERQQHLFDERKTKLRKVGTHHYGLAVDFAKRIGGQLSWDGDWTFMAELAAQHGAISGVDWGQPDEAHSFIDPGHLQGCTLAQQDALFAGAWYPGGNSVGTVAPTPPPPSFTQTTTPTIPQGLTVAQQAALTVADQVNANSFNGWFLRSSMMAFMEVESGFRPDAIRHEPSGVASYGLMQVLDTTAAWLGLRGDPAQMFEPGIGIFYGLKYAAHGWNYLLEHLNRQPTLLEWCEGYNIGYGAVAQGRSHSAYSDKWLAKRADWASLVD